MRWTLLVLVVARSVLANEAFFKAEVVDAIAAPKVPSTPNDAVWAKAPAHAFVLSPQRTVHLHDLKANEILAKPVRSEVQVKAVVAPDGLAVRLEWADPAREVVRTDESNVFADSVALETPEKFGAGLRLPAISMGDEGAVVDVTLLRATATGALESHFSAAGFGSLTRQAPGAPTTVMQYDEAAKRWAAVILLPRAHVKGLTPIAFATWDGARMERAGYKRLSSWHFVRVPGEALDATYVKEMAFGYEPGDLGDVARGRALGESICIACHRLPNKAVAPAGMAPALEDIGAIATAGYLRDSIVTPSAVVLHEPNPNQHYNATAPRDPNGAAPNNESYQWSSLGPDGKRVSKMPVFSNFTAGQVADLVAFLKTLDGQPKESTP